MELHITKTNPQMAGTPCVRARWPPHDHAEDLSRSSSSFFLPGPMSQGRHRSFLLVWLLTQTTGKGRERRMSLQTPPRPPQDSMLHTPGTQHSPCSGCQVDRWAHTEEAQGSASYRFEYPGYRKALLMGQVHITFINTLKPYMFN